MKSKRIIFIIAFILLLLIEVLIAIYVHDSFVRPYLGDVLVVWVVYSLVRIVEPERGRLLPLWVFLFAAVIEGLQALNIVKHLGLGNIAFFRILIGSVFDIKDIMCYAIGCVLLGIYELLTAVKEKRSKD